MFALKKYIYIYININLTQMTAIQMLKFIYRTHPYTLVCWLFDTNPFYEFFYMQEVVERNYYGL